jgi:hypothetical protein
VSKEGIAILTQHAPKLPCLVTVINSIPYRDRILTDAALPMLLVEEELPVRIGGVMAPGTASILSTVLITEYRVF